MSVTRCGSVVLSLLITASAAAQLAEFPPEEFIERRVDLCEAVGEGYVLLFGETMRWPSVRLRQENDFFYYTGVEDLNAAMLIDVSNDCAARLFLPSQSEREIRTDGANLLNDPAGAEEAGFATVDEMSRLAEVLVRTRGDGAAPFWVRFGETDLVDWNRYEVAMLRARQFSTGFSSQPSLSSYRLDILRTRFPNFVLRDVTRFIDLQRMIKTPREIEVLRRNALASATGIRRAIEITAPGVWEYELDAVASYEVRRAGGQGDGYPGIVASGPNLKTWHYERNNRQLDADDLIVMDYGGSFGYLVVDITRTWPVSGAFTERQQKIYECVLEAQRAVIAAMKPGATRQESEQICRDVYTKHGFGDHEPYGCNGHFVGMSVHDVGDYEIPYAAGMVIAIEPIIALDDEEIHVRIEDTVLVTEDGAEVLSSSLPKAMDDVLALVGADAER